MTLYHGGAVAVDQPDLNHSRTAVDFGPGFYVTPIYEQAVRWCEKRKRQTMHAAVSCYDFIVACRAERDDTDWDIVCGGVANDRVFDTLEAFFDGFATKEQTISQLMMREPNMQYCFRTLAALSTLRFERSVQL